QGVRPGAPARGCPRRDRDRRSLDEGPPVSGAPSIAVLDYGMGNLRSVEKALEHVGAGAEVTNDHDVARNAAGLVLPGVGAFPRAIEQIRELGLDELISERVGAGTPTLGICLGL